MHIRNAHAFLIVKAAISVALVVAVLCKVEFAEIVARLATANLGYVVACMLTAFPIIALSAWRWAMLAQGLINFPTALKYVLIGTFYSSVLPGAISGDIARGAALAAKETSMRTVVLPASILVDRLIGLTALGLIATLSFSLVCIEPPAGLAEFKSMLVAGAVLSAILAAVPIFLFSPWFERLTRSALQWSALGRLRAGVNRILIARSTYALAPKLMLRALCLSIVLHLFTVLGYVFAFHALGLAVSTITAVIFFSCLSIILLLPISISGLGVREVFALFFFTVLGASAEQAVAFSWLLLATSLVIALVGAGVQVWELHTSPNFDGRDA